MTPEEMTLDQLAQAIRRIQSGIKLWASLDEAIAIGRLLLRASRKLANGGYGRWRMGVGVPPKRANSYVALARHEEAHEPFNRRWTIKQALAAIGRTP
jgi:hypothetical protein